MKQQKDKLIQQGTSALGNIIRNNTKTKDTSKTATPSTTKSPQTQATDLINGLFNKKKKEEPKPATTPATTK